MTVAPGRPRGRPAVRRAETARKCSVLVLDRQFPVEHGRDPLIGAQDRVVEAVVTVGQAGSTAEVLEVDYERLLSDVEVGDALTLGDGQVVLQVEENDGSELLH